METIRGDVLKASLTPWGHKCFSCHDENGTSKEAQRRGAGPENRGHGKIGWSGGVQNCPKVYPDDNIPLCRSIPSALPPSTSSRSIISQSEWTHAPLDIWVRRSQSEWGACLTSVAKNNKRCWYSQKNERNLLSLKQSFTSGGFSYF